MSPSVASMEPAHLAPAPASAAALHAEHGLVKVLTSMTDFLKQQTGSTTAQKATSKALCVFRSTIASSVSDEGDEADEGDEGDDSKRLNRTTNACLRGEVSVLQKRLKRELESRMSLQVKQAKLLKHNRDNNFSLPDGVEVLGGGDGDQDSHQGPGPVHPEAAEDSGEVGQDELPYRLKQCRVPPTTANHAVFFPSLDCHFPHSMEKYKRSSNMDCHAHLIKGRQVQLEFRLFDREDGARYVDEHDLVVEKPKPIVEYEISVEYAEDHAVLDINELPKCVELFECVTSPSLVEVSRNLTMSRGRVCVRFSSFQILSGQTVPLHRKFCFVVRPKEPSLRVFPQLTARSVGFYTTSKSSLEQPAGRGRGRGRGHGRGRGRA